MGHKTHRATSQSRYRRGASFAALILAAGVNGSARDDWLRGLDLEPPLRDASLVLVGRVTRSAGPPGGAGLHRV